MTYKRKRHPRGVNYAKGLVLDKRIKTLGKQIRETEAKIERCQLVTSDGKEHIFQPFWTLAPRAYTRPVIEVKK